MQKTAEPIEMLFGELTLVGPRNHVDLLDGVKFLSVRPPAKPTAHAWSRAHLA